MQRYCENGKVSIRSIAFVCVVAVVACQDFTAEGLPLPYGSAPLTPPAVYSTWWSMTESCSGVNGDMSRVSWYSVPRGNLVDNGGEQLAGQFRSDGNRILLEQGVIDAGMGGIIRHEMLHALIQVPGHPRTQFLERCGGTVECPGPCVTDGGPPPVPPAGTPVVPSDSFDLAVALNTDTISAKGGYLAVTVTARNRASHPVVASLPLVGTFTNTFGIDIVRDSHLGAESEFVLNHPAGDSEALFFAAGETKRQVYDFLTTDAFFTVPGSYHATGLFGTRATASHLFTIIP